MTNINLSYIHPEAEIGKDVVISPFVTIHKNVKIGDGTWIGPNVVIMEGARIGKNCRIFPGAVISAIPQDLKYQGEETYVEIGDNTTIRECVTINKGTKARGVTSVGSNCLIMCYAHIAHDCEVGNNVIIGAYVGMAGEVKVDDYANIAGGTLIHQFVHIGGHVIIQGGSKVSKDVPPYIKAGREPLSYCGINTVGLRRRNFSNEKIEEIHEVYRWIYQRGLNNSDAIKYIKENLPQTPERDIIVSFVENSKRGIIKGYFDRVKNGEEEF